MTLQTPDAQSTDVKALTEQIGKLQATAVELSDKVQAAAKTGEQYTELKASFDAAKADLTKLVQEREQKEREVEAQATKAELDAVLKSIRSESKAKFIGSLGPDVSGSDTANFMATVAMAQSPRLAGGYQEAINAKAKLDEMGSHWSGVPAESKATVGDSDANGGYLVPNNVVLDINLQATAPRSVVDLFTVLDGVRGSAVDLPWEQETISRAVIAAAGSTKENSNFITNNYTATLYTLARIFDVGNQLLRQSAGAAEKLVRSKLARAFALGEDYYALSGSGSSQPYGLLTALGTSGTYVTSFTPSATTLAGSIAVAIATLAGVIENRGGMADGAVLNTGDYWTALAQGTDTAGLFFAPSQGPNGIDGTRPEAIQPFGIRVRHSPNMTTDNLVVGEFRSALFVRGDGYRVDTSSEAGDRWDKNLTGFRGEEEIAFDARPAVYTGHFQRITNLVA
jgi:HK97 family phage major capsid protein